MIVLFTDFYNNNHVIQATKNHKQKFRELVLATFVVTVTGMVTMGLKHKEDPRFPGFVYSVICTQVDNLWLEYILLLRESFVQIYTWGLVVQFILIYLVVSRTVEYCLIIVSYHNHCEDIDDQQQERSSQDVDTTAVTTNTPLFHWNNVGSPNNALTLRPPKSVTTTRKDMTNAIMFYQKLARIVHEVNEAFASLVSYLLGGTLAMCCIFAYIPLRHWRSTHAGSMLFYVFTFFSLVLVLSQFYPVLGIAHERSLQFKRSWTGWLASSEEIRDEQTKKDATTNGKKPQRGCCCDDQHDLQRLKLRLSACYPIGFKCGEFFVIRPSTTLTFFSVIATYLIIMLQFDL